MQSLSKEGQQKATQAQTLYQGASAHETPQLKCLQMHKHSTTSCNVSLAHPPPAPPAIALPTLTAVKRKIASLRAKLGVQKQILQGETSNPRSTQQVRDEYAEEMIAAEVARVKAEQDASDEHDAALQAAVLTQAVLGCVWSSLGQGALGDAAAAVIDRVGKADGELSWTAEVATAVGDEAQAAVDMLVEGGVVQLREVEGGQVLCWGA